jgi:excisionase family DNA binding protein
VPISLNSQNYLRTAEACAAAGISKNTFLRWVKDGVLPDVPNRDRRGWRLFTPLDVERLTKEANKTSRIPLKERRP